MAALITDKFTETTNGTRPDPTTVTSTRSAAATTLQCAALTGWPTATAVHFATYRTNAQGEKVAGSQCDWKGIVSGTQITNLTLKAGTDTGNSIGDTVVCMPTAAWADDVTEGLRVEHNIDGTHGAITATSATATGTVQGATVISTGDIQHRSTSIETIRNETQFDYVASGGVWSGDSYGSTRNASMTALTCYINGRRGTISAVTARTFTASKDTYVDVLNSSGTFSLVYTEVANNAASPSLAANSIRLGIIITGVSNIANAGSVNQGQETKVLPIASSVPYAVTDSLGNLICPRDPNRKILGYRQIVGGNFVTASATPVQITGLSVPVIIPAGRKAKVTVVSEEFMNFTSGMYAVVSIWDGVVNSGTQINQAVTRAATGTMSTPCFASAIVTPTSTSKTYNAGLQQAGGSQAQVSNAPTYPAYIMVELI